jgi:hypothetical protein
MHTDHITNENLTFTNFAKPEEAWFLQSKTRGKRTKGVLLAPGIPAHGVWMTDVSAMDRRSVKAQLAGRGDDRVAWWKLNCLIHRFLKPHASLEYMMFAFHARHHVVTLTRLELVNDFWCIFRAIKRDGPVAGILCAIRQVQQSTGEQT